MLPFGGTKLFQVLLELFDDADLSLPEKLLAKLRDVQAKKDDDCPDRLLAMTRVKQTQTTHEEIQSSSYSSSQHLLVKRTFGQNFGHTQQF